jgi:hypothetical protein
MARYVAGALTTAGSTTLPVFALVGGTTVVARIREIGVFNTTATAVALKLCRLSTAGTPGTTITPASLPVFDPAGSLVTVRNTYSGTAPTTTDLGYRVQLGAAVGSGFVWTWDDWELTTDKVASNGIGALVENGTGQALQFYIKWYEG